VTHSVAGVQTSVQACQFAKELFIRIPVHVMNREIIPGQEKEGSTVSSINCDHC